MQFRLKRSIKPTYARVPASIPASCSGGNRPRTCPPDPVLPAGYRGRCRLWSPPRTKMSDRHRRCRPECDDEAEIDRVPHKLVIQRRPETRRRHLAASKVVGDLVQSEQLEMIDQEC